MDRLYEEFGRVIRGLRKEARLTQFGLAKRVGLGRTSITNIELGRQHLPIHFLYPLAAALGTSPDKLLPAVEFALPGATASKLHPDLVSELERQDLGTPAKRWVQRVVLKNTTERRELTNDTQKARRKLAKRSQNTRNSDSG